MRTRSDRSANRGESHAKVRACGVHEKVVRLDESSKLRLIQSVRLYRGRLRADLGGHTLREGKVARHNRDFGNFGISGEDFRRCATHSTRAPEQENSHDSPQTLMRVVK